MQFLSWFLAGLSWMDTETVALVGIKPNVAIHFSLVLDAISKLVFGWLELDGHLTVVSTIGTVSKTMVAKAVVSVVGISSSLSLRGSSGLGVSGPLAVVSVVAVGVGVSVSVGTESVSVAVVAKAVVSVVGISLGLGLSNSGGLGVSRPLAVVSVVGIGISLGLGISQSEGNKASRNEKLHHGCS